MKNFYICGRGNYFFSLQKIDFVMNMKFLFVGVCMLLSVLCSAAQTLSPEEKCRLIVTTDLGGTDPDDIQSMIHLLVCSNVIDIEGLISSQVWMDDPDKTEKLEDVVRKFGEVLPRLKKHAAGYPDLDYLLSLVKRGQAKSNMDGVGEGKDSPGSELIISAVDKAGDKRPVWVAAWGGMNTVAQAVWKVKHTRTEKELERFINKLRIYDVLGQDDAGAWIAHNFPEIVYIRNKEVYGWAPSDEWTDEHIQCCMPLGAYYPDRMWATEGDSPSFLYVYANGLNVPDSLEYGGWGGRFSKKKTMGVRGMDFIEKSGKDETQYDPYGVYASTSEGVGSINKWQKQIWNDFAARMLWTSTDKFEDANHHPLAVLDGDASLHCVFRRVKAGDVLCFDASASKDVDGNELHYKWTIYEAPSTYKGSMLLDGDSSAQCTLQIPTDASGKSIHLILEVTDNGMPALTAYRRVVLNVE